MSRAVSQPSERERKDSVQSVSEMSENGSQVFLRFLGSAKTSQPYSEYSMGLVAGIPVFRV